jgi:hypothetical protein
MHECEWACTSSLRRVTAAQVSPENVGQLSDALASLAVLEQLRRLELQLAAKDWAAMAGTMQQHCQPAVDGLQLLLEASMVLDVTYGNAD